MGGVEQASRSSPACAFAIEKIANFAYWSQAASEQLVDTLSTTYGVNSKSDAKSGALEELLPMIALALATMMFTEVLCGRTPSLLRCLGGFFGQQGAPLRAHEEHQQGPAQGFPASSIPAAAGHAYRQPLSLPVRGPSSRMPETPQHRFFADVATPQRRHADLRAPAAALPAQRRSPLSRFLPSPNAARLRFASAIKSLFAMGYEHDQIRLKEFVAEHHGDVGSAVNSLLAQKGNAPQTRSAAAPNEPLASSGGFPMERYDVATPGGFPMERYDCATPSAAIVGRA